MSCPSGLLRGKFMRSMSTAISLFGFADVAERDWFRILLTVQGVGSRVALSLLSTLSPDQLATAIAAQPPMPSQAAGT